MISPERQRGSKEIDMDAIQRIKSMGGSVPEETDPNDSNYFGKMPHEDISSYNNSAYAPKFASP